MKKTEATETKQIVKHFWEAIEDIEVAMLVTRSMQDQLRSRPMFTQKIEKPDIIWFVTKLDDPKNQEIMKDNKVNVCYCNADHKTFISLSGEASIELNKEVIESVMKESDNAWAPQDRSHLSLIKVQIQEAEYWDSESGKMSFFEDFFDSGNGKHKNEKHSKDIHEKIQLCQ